VATLQVSSDGCVCVVVSFEEVSSSPLCLFASRTGETPMLPVAEIKRRQYLCLRAQTSSDCAVALYESASGAGGLNVGCLKRSCEMELGRKANDASRKDGYGEEEEFDRLHYGLRYGTWV